MGIPKKKKPIIQRKSRLDIEKAMKSAALMDTPGVSPEEGSVKNTVQHKSPEAKKTPPKPTKAKKQSPPPKPAPTPEKTKNRVGRPPLKAGRTERITVWFTPEVKKRLRRALLKEKLLRDEKDQDIDQSLLVEEALESWLASHDY
jgi:hypothetical protein